MNCTERGEMKGKLIYVSDGLAKGVQVPSSSMLCKAGLHCPLPPTKCLPTPLLLLLLPLPSIP